MIRTGSQESCDSSPLNHVVGVKRSLPSAKVIINSDEDSDVEILQGSPASPSRVEAKNTSEGTQDSNICEDRTEDAALHGNEIPIIRKMLILVDEKEYIS